MTRRRHFGAIGLCALVLSGCNLVSTSSAPTLINSNNVPLGLLAPTIPFSDFARVLFVTRDVYMVNKSELVVPEPQLVTSPPSLFDVLYYIPVGPTTSEQLRGISSQVPHSLVVNQATIQDGVALVDVSNQLAQLPSVARRVAVAQFLFTAVAMGASEGIRISINQTPFSLTLANGTSVSLITPSDLAYLKKS
ncbi:MAG TPA: hypothetical protein VIJ86_03770 [Acidimicrobiales bacterium]